MKFDLINPFATNGFLPRRKMLQSPSVVGFESRNLVSHGLAPFRILNSLQITLRFFDKGKGGGEGTVRGGQTIIR